MLSHRNMIATAESFVERRTTSSAATTGCATCRWRWVGDSLFTLGMSLVVGAHVQLPGEPGDGAARPARARPRRAAGAAAHLGEHADPACRSRAADASPLKRRVFEYFRGAGRALRAAKRSDGKPVPLGDRARPARWARSSSTARCATSSACAMRAGAYTGGAPLGPDTFRFFRSFGVNLKQVYGATEASALIACQADDEANPNTVGRPMPGHRGADRRARRGAWSRAPASSWATSSRTRPRATPSPPTAGSRPAMPASSTRAGHLVIIDRAKDVGKLADGSPFAPQFIENKLKFSPFIREAVAFGDQRPFVAAMIAIDMQHRRQLGRAAGPRLHQLHGPQRASPRSRGLIGEEIAKVNATLPDVQQVQRFLLLNKELEADDAEMTRTRKVRRALRGREVRRVIEALLRRQARPSSPWTSPSRTAASRRSPRPSPSTARRRPSRRGRRREDGADDLSIASPARTPRSGGVAVIRRRRGHGPQSRSSPMTPRARCAGTLPFAGSATGRRRDIADVRRPGIPAGAGAERRLDRPDVFADRAGLRAGLQGDRRHQLRPGRIRHAGRHDRGDRAGRRGAADRGHRRRPAGA